MITSFIKHAVLVSAFISTSFNTDPENICIQTTPAAPPAVSGGLINVIVEKYYTSNAADSLQADVESTENGLPTGALPVGSVTYRIYADMLPGYTLLGIYADQTNGHDLKIESTSLFYNNPSGGINPNSNKASLKNKLLALDSWFSLGGVATGQYGILKTEDDGSTNNITATNNAAGVLLNNDTTAGVSLITKDGMITGTGIQSAAFAGFDDNLNILGDGTVTGNSLVSNAGFVFAPNGAIGPAESGNKVLIAQITTKGSLTFELNLLLRAPDDSGEYYVAKNPLGEEILFSGLLHQ